MLILKSNDKICPNCNASGKHIQDRSKDKICISCSHFWHPTTDGMQGTRVRVIATHSVWLGMIGVVTEIKACKGRNVRVSFPPTRTDTFADLFHPAHLEQV